MMTPQRRRLILSPRKVSNETESDPFNVALAANGTTTTATSTGGSSTPAATINGLRHTNNAWGSAAGGWESGNTASVGNPEGIEYNFNASRTISEINLFTIADAVNYNTDPTLADTFSSYGIENFTVDYWNGSSWVNIVTVTGNNKVWYTYSFSPVVATKARVMVTKGKDNATARIIETEIQGF